MAYRGRVKNGTIELEPGVVLPEGAEVEIRLCNATSEEAQRGQLDPVFRLNELAVETGITDLAKNIDHYLYGHPKVDDDD